MTDQPVCIALTVGEPAGIGPDICIQLARQSHDVQVVAIGDKDVLAARTRQLGAVLNFIPYQSGKPSVSQAGTLQVLHVPVRKPVIAGKLDPDNAGYVLETLDRAVDGCLAGEFAAMVTAPVSKAVINDAGIAFTGHTEYLAARCHAAVPVMMLVADNLRVALATTHLPLSSVPAAITRDALIRTLQVLHDDLQHRFSLATPHILVLGLNPHAGENGHLGREEIEVITPVCEQFRSRGLHVTGPVAADTAFNPQRLDQLDAVLAMYHDQGLPVLKYAGFGHAVNVTLGLPIIRTSVDHGTALELAGTGRADHGSLEAALALAVSMSRSK